MRQLVLMRHAEAAPAGPGIADRDRPLTRRGRLAAALMGAYLAEILAGTGTPLARALVSDARRTRETYEAMRPLLGAAPEPALAAALYGAATAELWDILRETPPETPTLLVLGHNPTLESAVAEISGRRGVSLPPAGLALLALDRDWADIAPGAAHLAAFETPRSLV